MSKRMGGSSATGSGESHSRHFMGLPSQLAASQRSPAQRAAALHRPAPLEVAHCPIQLRPRAPLAPPSPQHRSAAPSTRLSESQLQAASAAAASPSSPRARALRGGTGGGDRRAPPARSLRSPHHQASGGGSQGGSVMEAMAEAMASAAGEEDIEKKVEQALACPCLGASLLPPRCTDCTNGQRPVPACAESSNSCRGPALCSLTPAGDLKEGPCGPVFVHAFGCFIRSEHEDKGMDCLEDFKKFQARRRGEEGGPSLLSWPEGEGRRGACASELAVQCRPTLRSPCSPALPPHTLTRALSSHPLTNKQVCLQKHPEHVARIMDDSAETAGGGSPAAAAAAAAASPAAAASTGGGE